MDLGEYDVVVSGGGNFDGYYMGIQMILNRLRKGGHLTRYVLPYI